VIGGNGTAGEEISGVVTGNTAVTSCTVGRGVGVVKGGEFVEAVGPDASAVCCACGVCTDGRAGAGAVAADVVSPCTAPAGDVVRPAWTWRAGA